MRRRALDYIPALGYFWLTPVFDLVLAWTTREERFKRRLINQGNMSGAMQVLDLGCGTGTLAVWTKQQFPTAMIVGIDADEGVLSRARAKAAAAEVNVQFDKGLAAALPYGDGSFDRVVSSLFFHHLNRTNKDRALREVLRVLKPGGELHIADWGRPTGPVMRVLFLLVQIVDSFDATRDNVGGRLPALVEQTGFTEVQERGAMNMLFGTLRFLTAVKPKAPERLETESSFLPDFHEN